MLCHWWPWNTALWLMVFSATFNNISVIWWQSVLFVEETGVPGENHWPVASRWQTLSHMIVLCRVHLSMNRFELTTYVVIGTGWTCSCNPTTIWLRPRRPPYNTVLKDTVIQLQVHTIKKEMIVLSSITPILNVILM